MSSTNQPMLPIELPGDVGSHALDDYLASLRSVPLSTVLDEYDVLEAKTTHIVAAERDPNLAPGVAVQEMGYSSPSPWTSWTRDEWNPKLRDVLGMTEYYRMKRTDGTVRGALRLLKTPIQAAHWFVEPASDSTIDKNIAKFVEKNLFEDLNVSWSRVLDDVLLMCEYGFFVFEKVFTVNDDGKIVLKKLGPRHPMDVMEWIYDINGGPNGVIMNPNNFDDPEGIFIPISKLAIFSLEAEAGDLRGTSVLRSAYKHWYYKDTLYKIDAIQKERHGIGIPVIKLPPGWTKRDRLIADEIGRNLRTNERAHVVLPPFWELIFAKLEGQPVDCITSINHHDERIVANILAPFANSPDQKREAQDLFYKSTRYIAETVADTFNKHIIRQLVDFNFRRGSYPNLRARRIGEWEDVRTASFALRNFVGAGLITPDDPLEVSLRRDLDLPAMDPTTSRKVATPQAGGLNPPKAGPAGPPRQAKTPPIGTGKSNAGKDASGG